MALLTRQFPLRYLRFADRLGIIDLPALGDFL
jgi:hypothetical protein